MFLDNHLLKSNRVDNHVSQKVIVKMVCCAELIGKVKIGGCV